MVKKSIALLISVLLMLSAVAYGMDTPAEDITSDDFETNVVIDSSMADESVEKKKEDKGPDIIDGEFPKENMDGAFPEDTYVVNGNVGDIVDEDRTDAYNFSEGFNDILNTGNLVEEDNLAISVFGNQVIVIGNAFLNDDNSININLYSSEATYHISESTVVSKGDTFICEFEMPSDAESGIYTFAITYDDVTYLREFEYVRSFAIWINVNKVDSKKRKN